jgi:hypothetical protein
MNDLYIYFQDWMHRNQICTLSQNKRHNFGYFQSLGIIIQLLHRCTLEDCPQQLGFRDVDGIFLKHYFYERMWVCITMTRTYVAYLFRCDCIDHSCVGIILRCIFKYLELIGSIISAIRKHLELSSGVNVRQSIVSASY